MRILLLGGTVFVGRHLALAAIERGHAVTLFNRGRSGPEGAPPGATRLVGDRDGGLGPLEAGRWDAVLDFCGYLPRVVRASARLLAPRTGLYVFVSSISVYDDPRPGADEHAPVGVLEDPTVETIDGKTYGPLKALCEKEVQEATTGRCLIVRPGLIAGPYDPTCRFTYWPHRLAGGGRVLVPDVRAQAVQLIDARDLAGWILTTVEKGVTGTFNATGPETSLTFGEVIGLCKAVTGSPALLEWVPEDFLLKHEVQPFMQVPLWIPAGSSPGFFAIDTSRARQAGLTLRPLSDTARDTLEWDRSLGERAPRGASMTRETEAKLLAEWDRARV